MNKELLEKLQAEYDDLMDKDAKAWSAAGNSNIPDEQRQLIGIQANAMETYAQVLAIRIHLLEK
ncbi:crAss001_48 related protein [Lactiplantibacillus paraxiangfangensis]|uniref:crAss001_48 related protein n=1 Tax=Lactiplantibacillus paraxiangfangensis TaxID=3076224 RepID=UPI0030C6AF73